MATSAAIKDTTKKLTSGKPMSLILGFSLPLLVGMLFQQFYSLVDTIIVGKFLGVDALAAVGSTGSVNFLINGFCMGVCTGFAIPVAHRLGAEDYDGLRKFVGNSIWLASAFAIAMAISVSAACRWILEIMQTPANIIDDAYSYIFIIFLGIPATYLYNLTAGIIRSLGDSKTPVYLLMMASAMNIVLDILFITQFHSGVAGAAYATITSQLVSGICCVIFMYKRFPILRLQREDLKLNTHYAMNLCGMGVPMGLQYSITAIGSVILQTAVNGLGSAAVAAITAGSKLSMFVVCPFDALGSTMATYGGQNVGAGKLCRIKEGLKSATLLGAIYSIFALILLAACSHILLLLFLSPDETVILTNARMFLLLQATFYFPLALVNIIRFLIQGMGFPIFAILAGVMEMIARTLAAFLLVPSLAFFGASLASPIAWIMADIFLIPAFFYVYRKLERKLKNPQALNRF